MKHFPILLLLLLLASCAGQRTQTASAEMADTLAVPAYSTVWNDSTEAIADPTVARIYRSTIYPLAQAIAHQDKRRVAAMTGYPFRMLYPLRDLQSEQELIDNWDLIYDDAYCSRFAEATPDDWGQVGWRGIMFDNGIFWLDEYYSGDTVAWLIRYAGGRAERYQQEMQRLLDEEARLLDLADNEVPIGCYIAPDSSLMAHVTLLRRSERYRLRIFLPEDRLTSPSYEVVAKSSDGGTCNNEYYYGTTGDTIVQVWNSDCGGREPDHAYGCAFYRTDTPSDEYVPIPDSARYELEPCLLRDVAYLWQ